MVQVRWPSRKRFAPRQVRLRARQRPLHGHEPPSAAMSESDNLHSIYVDQWDWGKRSSPARRRQTRPTLERHRPARIHAAVLEAETVLHSRSPPCHAAPAGEPDHLSPQRGTVLTCSPGLRARGARAGVCEKAPRRVRQSTAAGRLVATAAPMAGAPRTTDDWSLNGDLLYYHPELDCCLGSFLHGISRGRIQHVPHSSTPPMRAPGSICPSTCAVMEEKLPLTIGGAGIGQSRLCMLLLRKGARGRGAGFRLA